MWLSILFPNFVFLKRYFDMKFTNDFLSVDMSVQGNTLKFKVVDQSPELSNILKKNKMKSGEFSLLSNNKPAFKASKKIFFVRGKETEENDKQVECQFASREEALGAKSAFLDIMEQLADESTTGVAIQPGAIGDVRTSIITRDQAKILCLTNSKHYPATRKEWIQTPPSLFDENSETIVANIEHYNEHIGQLVDVMNKSVGNVPPTLEQGVVNPHKISSAAAAWAVSNVRDLYDRAHAAGKDHLIATWRLISGLRGPDLRDIDEDDNE
jgi:hypothetical protein